MDTFNSNQMPNIGDQKEKRSLGPLIAVLIILALIVVGGLYFLKERSSQNLYIPETQLEDSVVESLNQQGASDDLDSIEADLKATDLENFDQGASVIETELQN